MKRIRLRLAVGILVLAIATVAVWTWNVRRREQHHVILFGNVDIRQVQLAFNNNERISAVLVQEGDRVHTGQLLATLDSRRFEAKVAESESRLMAQREVVARLEAGNRPEEIQKARADMEAAQADLHHAQATFERVKDLRGRQVVPPQDLDDARAALDVATARLAAARQSHDLMVLGPRMEEIAAARAMLKAHEAELTLAKQDLMNATLHSPTNGVIQNRLLEPGDMASPQKPVFTLALDDPVWVRAYVAETDLGRIRPGMKADVTTDSFPDKNYDGWIGFISPTAEFTPKTVESREVRTRLVYQVRVFVPNPQGELRLGMPAVVSIARNPPQP